MKNLRIFKTTAEFEAAKPSIDTPWVVLNEENGEVLYSNLPTISEDDLTKGDFVDLGLSVNWATCNLGAEKPCDYGLYYQWGATEGYEADSAEGKAHSSWATAPFNNGASTFDETYFNSVKDEVCPNGVLATQYDAAYQATGGAMRMPTMAEYNELLSGTTHQWCQCTVLGADHETHTVYGRLLTSKTDDTKKLFIPASGFFILGSFGGAGSYGYIWSSSLNTGDASYAWHLSFSSSSCGTYDDHHFSGFAVRGVSEKD